MNLFELFVKIGVDDQASGKLSNLSSKLGNGLKTAAKIGTAAVGAAATGITALTKAAVDNYAEYEQLVGGVETLFKESSQKVQEYAANAYKTAGMSANEYMSTVTSFSASLLQSLGGDTEAAAEYANQALTDMSDNANKMGTSMEMIQNAYQGFAKQNYTMLDNLKLGYGGTKEEMARLIEDAAKLSDTVDAQDMSFANIVKAINVVQTEMGITGTTALEAGRTISGSVGAMKSAWTNLVTGFADGSADIGGLIDNLVTTIVGDGTENNLGVIGNVLPAVERALSGIGRLIEGAIPVLIERLPGLLQQILPVLLSSATSLVNSVIDVLPELVDLIVDTLIDNAPMLIVAAVELILALAGGLIGAVPKLLQAIPTIIKETVDGFKNSENIKKFLQVGKDFVSKVGEGFKSMLSYAKTWGKDLLDNFIGGIKARIQKLKDMVSNVAQTVKDFLGFSEPKKGPLSNFHTYAPDMMDLFAKGIRDNEDVITDQIEKSFNFGERTMKFGAEYGDGFGVTKAAGMAYGGTSIGSVTINIDGAEYDDPRELAMVIAEELQNMADRSAAVYA